MNTNIHVDCDPLWVYASEYGLAPDHRNDTIYTHSLPLLAEMIEQRGLRATFFVIGRDLQLPACVQFCQRILRAGHQIGNHTLSHLDDLHTAPPEVRKREITACHEAILQATGHACQGIRCPGYYFDAGLVETLAEMGYTYDASILPGAGVYMMSLFYILFNKSGRNKRFGRKWYMFTRRSPHLLGRFAGGNVWEFPLGAFPILSLPIHSTFVFRWGMPYLRAALAFSRALRPHLVYLFHAIDLLEGSAAGDVASRVATLRRTLEERSHMVATALDWLARDPVTTTEDLISRVCFSGDV